MSTCIRTISIDEILAILVTTNRNENSFNYFTNKTLFKLQGTTKNACFLFNLVLIFLYYF